MAEKWQRFCCKLFAQSNGEWSFKIDQHLAKLWTNNMVGWFCDSRCALNKILWTALWMHLQTDQVIHNFNRRCIGPKITSLRSSDIDNSLRLLKPRVEVSFLVTVKRNCVYRFVLFGSVFRVTWFLVVCYMSVFCLSCMLFMLLFVFLWA